MELAEILKQAGANKKRKRVGRGIGSGSGKTCGRGHKGAGSRAGSKRFSMSEGGQMPLFRRLPKRGFSNFAFKTRYAVVNVGDLEGRFDDGAHVTPEAILEASRPRVSPSASMTYHSRSISADLTVKVLTLELLQGNQPVSGTILALALPA